MGCGTLHRGIRHGITRGADCDGLPWYAAELYGPAVHEERDPAHEFLRGFVTTGPARRLHDGQVRRDAAGRTRDRAGDRYSFASLLEGPHQRASWYLADGLAERETRSLVSIPGEERKN